jgi:hypothetical protein
MGFLVIDVQVWKKERKKERIWSSLVALDACLVKHNGSASDQGIDISI